MSATSATSAALPPSRGRRVRATLSVGLVLALAGLMFTASARLARGDEARHPENLAQLVESESDRVARLSAKVDALSDEIAVLSAEQGSPASADPNLSETTSVAVGTVPVTGPGITVSLDDAPPDGVYPSEVRPDDLVVHQQDVQAVINALWAGGAEAMTLQGQRVTAMSAFRCAGNILTLHGRVFSPPYVVQVVGDPTELRAALDRSPAISTYKSVAAVVDLGWKVEESSYLELPRYEGAIELEYARVGDETEAG